MSHVGIRALKQNASAVVAEASAGACVTITDHGRPVARMVPMTHDRIEALVSAGRARRPLQKLSNLPAPARRRRGRPTLAQELDEMRRAERY